MTVLWAVLLTLLGGLMYYGLYRFVRNASQQDRLIALWMTEPIAVLFGSKSADPLHANTLTKAFREAMSRESFEQARTHLSTLAPGGRVTIPFREAQHPRSTNSVLFADGWIGDYSGRYLEGDHTLGQLTALHGDTLHGVHIFGYLSGHHHLIPAYRLETRAQVGWDERARSEEDQTLGPNGMIWVDGKKKPLYLRDVVVHALLPIAGSWEARTEDDPVELVDDRAKVEALFNEPLTPERFRDAERELQRLPEGCKRWEMMDQLGGKLTTLTGFDTVIRMDGYLNFTGKHRWTKITPQGIFLALPFGYIEEKNEVPKLVAVFLNDRFHKLLPSSPRKELERELGI